MNLILQTQQELKAFEPRCSMITETPVYRDNVTKIYRALASFDRLVSEGAQPPNLNPKDARTVREIQKFIEWIAQFGDAWDKGLSFTGSEIALHAGRANDPSALTQARRACFVVKEKGNRRRGGTDKYTLNRPAVIGLMTVLAQHEAMQCLMSVKKMELEEQKLIALCEIEDSFDEGDSFLDFDFTTKPALLK